MTGTLKPTLIATILVLGTVAFALGGAPSSVSATDSQPAQFASTTTAIAGSSTNELVDRWPADDGSGTVVTGDAWGFDGDYNGGWTTTGTVSNSGLSLDGTNDRVNLGKLGVAKNGTFSVHFSTSDDLGALVDSAAFGGSGVATLGVENGKLLGRMRVGGVDQSARSTTTVNGSTLHHAAFTWHYYPSNNTTVGKLYLNGSLVDSFSATGQPDDTDLNPTYVGASPNSANFLSGTVDEFRIYKSTLNGSQISSLNTNPTAYLANSETLATSTPGLGDQTSVGPKPASTSEDEWRLGSEEFTDGSRNFADNPSVIKANGKYHLFYTSKDANGDYHISHATSQNLKDWTVQNRDILGAANVSNPSVVKGPDGKYHLYYVYFPGGTNSHEIHHAISSDTSFGTWTKDSANPVLTKSSSGWDSQRISYPEAVVVNDRFYLFYRGQAPDNSMAIGYAISTEGSDFSKSASNPVFTPTATWEGSDVGHPDIGFHNGTWYLAYMGGGNDNQANGTGLATTQDLTTNSWNRDANNPEIPSPASGWGSTAIAEPELVYYEEGGEWRMLVGGKYDASNETIGLAYGPSGDDVSGRVVNQLGDGIPNATVKVIGSRKVDVDVALGNLSELSNPIPTEFQTQLDDDLELVNKWGEIDSEYVGIYSASDVGTAAWSDKADLSDPFWRRVPTDEDLVVIIADPTGRCGIGGTGVLENEYNEDIPGCTERQGTVILESLSAGDEATSDPLTFNLTHKAGGGFGDPSSLKYAEIPAGTLAPGFYLVTAKVDGERSEFSYVIRVGEPLELVNQYRRDATGKLTDLANQIRAAKNPTDGIVVLTTTTNETGHFSVDVSKSVTAVHVQAYKAPDVPESGTTSLTLDNISKAYSGDNPAEGSVYMPARPRRVAVPATDLTITMVELSFPAQGGDLSLLLDLIADLRDRLEKLSRAGEVPAQLEALSEETRSELESVYQSLRRLVEANPDVRDRYLDLSPRDSIADADELTRSELEREIGYMSTALRTVDADGVTGGDGVIGDDGETVETGNETVSVSWETEIPDGAVVEVFVDYSNGTTEVVDDRYINVDKRPGRTDVVSVEEYPLGTTDPAQAAFRLTVSSSEGVVRETTPVTNPTFNGNLPEIRSLDFSTLRPGPAEKVSVTVRGNDEVKKVVSATVYAPDGSKITPSVSGSTIKFTTVGKGLYKVRYTVQNLDGQNFTTATTVKAASKDRPMPATVRAREGMLGPYLAVGEHLEDGELEVDGGTTRITAQIPEGADVPNRIHVHVESLTASASNVQIAVVEGDDRRSVDHHIIVKYHTGTLADSTLVWRGPDEPITRDGSTKYGEISTRQNGSTISTYTRSTGEVELEIVRDPGILTRIEHRVDVIRANFNIPGVVAAPVAPLGSTPGLAPRGVSGATLAPVLALGAAALLTGGGRT